MSNRAASGVLTRRTFLKAGAGGAALALLPYPRRTVAANEKLNVACIGVGGMGSVDSHAVASSPHVRVAAICDVEAGHLERAAKDFRDAKHFRDWRELFAELGDRVDAVTVSTPDHTHAAVAMTALRRGKHVYCQKPLTHDLHEARQLTQAAARPGLATQMGIQLSSGLGERMGVQMIQDGMIGKTREVYLWSNKPPEDLRAKGPRPEGEDPVPESFSWDNWLGTAPARPFKAGVYAPARWRGWVDFGTGWLGDMGCHIINPAFTALRLPPARAVRAEVEPQWIDAPDRRSETYPQWQVIAWEFAGCKLAAGPTLRVTWMDGGKFPPDELLPQIDAEKWQPQGGLYIGEGGLLLLPHESGPQLFPKEKFAGIKRPELEPKDHYQRWVDACRGEGRTNAGFEHSGPLTEMVLLGAVASRCPGKTLEWDTAGLKFRNSPEANRLVRRKYRAGWEVEGLS